MPVVYFYIYVYFGFLFTMLFLLSLLMACKVTFFNNMFFFVYVLPAFLSTAHVGNDSEMLWKSNILKTVIIITQLLSQLREVNVSQKLTPHQPHTPHSHKPQQLCQLSESK